MLSNQRSSRPQFGHRDGGLTRGWRSIHVTDGDQPYMKNWWVPGLQIGYEHSFVHQVADFVAGLASGKPAAPTFRDGLATVDRGRVTLPERPPVGRQPGSLRSRTPR